VRALPVCMVHDYYALTSNNKDTLSMSVYARQQLVDFQEVGYDGCLDRAVHDGGPVHHPLHGGRACAVRQGLMSHEATTRFWRVLPAGGGDLMAASVIVTVPVVALVLIFQRPIVSGLTAGPMKG